MKFSGLIVGRAMGLGEGGLCPRRQVKADEVPR